MKRLTTALGALALTAGAATAGGIDRSGQSIGILFEKGNYAELSFGRIMPKVSGVGAGTVANPAQPTPGAASGNMALDYTQIGGGVKFNLGQNLDAAIIFDQPFGADVSYPAGTGYYAQGTTADLNTSAITGVLKYRLPSNISIYGGVRYETLEAVASIPFVGGYTVNGARDGGVGYLVGAAFEKPEIALRVALTYNSEIDHSLATTEFGAPSPDTKITSPQSLNLEFQSGVAKDTLVFGSVRWVDWSAYNISPAVYTTITGSPLVSYAKDTVTYSLGVGRKFNENWSAAVSLGYEKPTGGFSSNLGPTDGKKSITIGGSYTRDNMKLTGGVTYVDIGNTQTTLGGGLPAADFRNNSAVGVGFKVGFSF
ncbi:MAG: hypothetical protein Q8P60_11290 [Pseudorhodobacter sp.]|nr:hypothetical protein [Pseudorhodobacter sp.]